MNGSVLVVEDEEVLSRGLVDALKFNGYRPEVASDGPAGYRLARSDRFDLILLDIMLPGLSGFDILSRIRSEGVKTPVIFLTAKGEEEDRVRGLKLGGDDYVTKPFAILELLARIEAKLRRCRMDKDGSPSRVRVEDVEIDFSRLECWRGRACESLTRREADILLYLMEHRDRVVTREELLLKVWDYPTGQLETRTVDMHMAKLRQKIEPNPTIPKVVLTVRGEGYKFSSEVRLLS